MRRRSIRTVCLDCLGRAERYVERAGLVPPGRAESVQICQMCRSCDGHGWIACATDVSEEHSG